MKKMLVGGLSIVGMVMLVGCGGGSTPSTPSTPSAPTDNTDNTDTLKITKISDLHFTMEWNKGYNGYSEVVYFGDNILEEHGARLASNNFTGHHSIDCISEGPDVYAVGKISYECIVTGPRYDGEMVEYDNPLNFNIIVGESYELGMNYSTSREWQGAEYIISYTSGTLTGL